MIEWLLVTTPVAPTVGSEDVALKESVKPVTVLPTGAVTSQLVPSALGASTRLASFADHFGEVPDAWAPFGGVNWAVKVPAAPRTIEKFILPPT